MSDFGSLLNQFKNDVKQLPSSKRSSTTSGQRQRFGDEREAANNNNNGDRPQKRPRGCREQEAALMDVSTFAPVTNIFCLCPANVQTGGPEALHQLCHEINRAAAAAAAAAAGDDEKADQQPSSSVRAYMLYVKSSGDGRIIHVPRAQTPPLYRNLYPDATVDSVDVNPLMTAEHDPSTAAVKHGATASSTSSSTLLIWPECWTEEMLDYLDNSCRTSMTTSTCHQCAIWWLSVNNNTGRFQEWHRTDVLHLYQSEYAKRYIQAKTAAAAKGRRTAHVLAMTEYISMIPEPLPPPPAANEGKQDEQKVQSRTIDVLYNPLKGMHYTDAIQKRSGSVMTIRPIGGGPHGKDRLSAQQVRDLLQHAKIFIDFGPHPGMDRLPREAALAGCCVITNREGAAQYDEDVPLLSRYKVDKFDADVIHKVLQDLLQHFDERSKDFDDYRDWIRGQKDGMQKCVSDFLTEIVDKRIQRRVDKS